MDDIAWDENVWEEENFWDDEAEYGVGGARRRSRKPWWGILLIVLIIAFLGWGILSYMQRQTPIYAAQTWFEAAMSFDSTTVLDHTCIEQIGYANAIGLGASLTGVLELLKMDIVNDALDSFGLGWLDLDLTSVLDQVRIDGSHLKYDEVLLNEETAVVTVTGHVRVGVGRGEYGIPIDEQWQNWLVVREDDQWKWCGLYEQ